LSHHGPAWNSTRGGAVKLQPGDSKIPISANYMQLKSEADGSALIFNPATAKFHTLQQRLLRLLKSCDGNRSLQEILEGAERDGAERSQAIRALNQAVREDLLTLISAEEHWRITGVPLCENELATNLDVKL
jgi:hypothetical protein